MKEIGVLGAGSWGTALAVHLARVGHGVRLWAREPEVVEDMKNRRENTAFLAGVPLPDAVRPCSRFEEALEGVDLVLIVTPSHGTRAVLRAAAPWVRPAATIVSATKGLEHDTLLRASEVIGQEMGPTRPVVVLSGPSFAREVAAGLPTAVCAASASAGGRRAGAGRSSAAGSSASTRRTDVVGVEIGAALKNVIAIAAGVVEGLGLGPQRAGRR